MSKVNIFSAEGGGAWLKWPNGRYASVTNETMHTCLTAISSMNLSIAMYFAQLKVIKVCTSSYYNLFSCHLKLIKNNSHTICSIMTCTLARPFQSDDMKLIPDTAVYYLIEAWNTFNKEAFYIWSQT